MKQTLSTLLLLASFSLLAQQPQMKKDTVNGKWYTSKDFSPPSKNLDDDKPFSFVTHKKDTLFLVNEGIGLTIAKVWEGDFYKIERDGKKPKIVFTTQNYIVARHSKNTQSKYIVHD